MTESQKLKSITQQLMMEALDSVRDGVVIVDSNSRIIYLNDAYLRILQVRREKALNKLMSEIEPDAIILDSLRDKKPRVNALVQVKSRSKRILANITPIISDNILIGAISVFKDMTEVYMISRELKNTQRLSKSIFNAVSVENMTIPPEFSHVIGRDEKFLHCLQLAKTVAPTDATVLIEGESGTGKEVIVNAILSISGPRRQPFVNLNCSAIPESLFESELFGYTSGSFTGASKNGKIGKFELAHKGTIFLDEIGEMPLFMQSKLLRVLQSGEIQKIGSDYADVVDVRVIAATNRDLKQMVQEGKFREDLYFRLNTFKIVIPPLRERRGDILLLAEYFIRKFNDKYGKQVYLGKEAAGHLQKVPWLGNVRQLESCIEYAVIVCKTRQLQIQDLPEDIQNGISEAMETLPKTSQISIPLRPAQRLKNDIQNMERERMRQALLEADGNKTKAMDLLGISRRTFYKKWKLYGFDNEIYTK